MYYCSSGLARFHRPPNIPANRSPIAAATLARAAGNAIRPPGPGPAIRQLVGDRRDHRQVSVGVFLQLVEGQTQTGPLLPGKPCAPGDRTHGGVPIPHCRRRHLGRLGIFTAGTVGPTDTLLTLATHCRHRVDPPGVSGAIAAATAEAIRAVSGPRRLTVIDALRNRCPAACSVTACSSTPSAKLPTHSSSSPPAYPKAKGEKLAPPVRRSYGRLQHMRSGLTTLRPRR